MWIIYGTVLVMTCARYRMLCCLGIARPDFRERFKVQQVAIIEITKYGEKNDHL